MKRNAGFTLIEMVVVVAIVAILAAAAQPMLSLAMRRQKEFELHRALRTLRTAIDAYHDAANEGRIARSATIRPAIRPRCRIWWMACRAR